MTGAPDGNAEIVTAAPLVIGGEILSDRTKNKNVGFVAGISHRHRHRFFEEVRIVPDEEPEIVGALNALRAR